MEVDHAGPSTGLRINFRRHPGDGQVIPLENGIQVNGLGMDPGFHRGDDKAGMTEISIDV